MEAIKPEIDHGKIDVGIKRIGLNRAESQGLGPYYALVGPH